jgi:outer membrane protein TolC
MRSSGALAGPNHASPRRAALACSIASLVLAPAAFAQTPPAAEEAPPAEQHHVADEHPHAPHRMSRREATQLGAMRGTAVIVARAPQAAAAEARSAADSLLTLLPRANLTAGYRQSVFGSGPELGASVIQDLHLGSVRAARRDVARAFGHLTGVDLARARLDAGARAALAWIAMAEAEELVRIRQASFEQAEGILATVRARVKSGVAEPSELTMSLGEVGAARAGVLDAEGMLFEARLELRFATGLAPGEPVEAAGDLYVTDDRPPDEAGLVRMAERGHPAIETARARADLAREETRLTAAFLSPTVGVGVSYMREGTGDQIVTGIVGVPLPFSNPAAYDTARRRAEADVARAELKVTRAELARDIRAALHEREHAREVRDAIRTGAIEPMSEALRIARAQLAAGTREAASVLLARQRLLTTQEQLARAAADVMRADVRLGRASGTLAGEMP